MKRQWLASGVLVSGMLLMYSFSVAQIPATKVAPPPAGAAAVPVRGPALDIAIELAQAALSACKAKSSDINVAVVDSVGEAKVMLSADGSGGKPSTALRKAFTALTFKASGAELEQREKTDAEFAAKIAANPALYNDHAGSLLLKAGNEVIGAIGISGSPTHEIGAACAQEALGKVQGRLR